MKLCFLAGHFFKYIMNVPMKSYLFYYFTTWHSPYRPASEKLLREQLMKMYVLGDHY